MSVRAIDDVISALRFAPAGMTTRQIAAHVGAPNLDSLGNRLSKLADYGKIAREYHRGPATDRYTPTSWCVWKLKEVPAHV